MILVNSVLHVLTQSQCLLFYKMLELHWTWWKVHKSIIWNLGFPKTQLFWPHNWGEHLHKQKLSMSECHHVNCRGGCIKYNINLNIDICKCVLKYFHMILPLNSFFVSFLTWWEPPEKILQSLENCDAVGYQSIPIVP